MNLFIQGMRRSGTTILFDALREDPELRCFYEPLREESETLGGGSGARSEDAFAETRAMRHAFRRERYPEMPIEEFNCGGPRAPALELDPELPPHCREWISFLLAQGSQVAIKETRLHHKVGALAALDPDAALVHVVRDPRAVASSIVLGRGRKRLGRVRDPDRLFADREPRKLWSSRAISERLLERPEYAGISDPSNILRVLMVWRATFEATWEEGRSRFGERYLLLRNEDLRVDPAGALERLYSQLGRAAPAGVSEWATAHIRRPEPPFAAGDGRWLEEIGCAGLEAAMERAGYPAELPELAAGSTTLER